MMQKSGLPPQLLDVLVRGRNALLSCSSEAAKQILLLDDFSDRRRSTPVYLMRAAVVLGEAPPALIPPAADAILVGLHARDWSATTAFVEMLPQGAKRSTTVMIGMRQEMVSLPEDAAMPRVWQVPARHEVVARFAMVHMRRAGFEFR